MTIKSYLFVILIIIHRIHFTKMIYLDYLLEPLESCFSTMRINLENFVVAIHLFDYSKKVMILRWNFTIFILILKVSLNFLYFL